MRPLTEHEARVVFEKLFKFVGKDVQSFLGKRRGESHCFRLHRQRVYYCRESLMKKATNVARDRLVSLGTQLGRFTKGGSFRLTITSLELIAELAKHKVWLKASAEMSFLYGNNVLKSSMARITEGTPANAGVVVFSMADVPLGFGVSARATDDFRKLDPHSIVVLHQSDIGEYLREEAKIGG